jgi:hypothetical protein
MKRKDLYNYIRTEIISELSLNEGTAEETAAKAAELKSIEAQIKALTTKKSEVAKSGAVAEAEIDEARKAGGFRIGDTAKFTEAKELYSNGLYADILNAIESAGDDGITQKELGIKLGKGDGSSLNPILNKFLTIGVFGGGKLAKTEKPEKVAKLPATLPDEFKDLFSTDIVNKSPKIEPVPYDDEDPELSTTKVVTKSDEANKAIAIISTLTDKIKDMENGVDRDKKLAALKQYISNNKNLLTGISISNITKGLLGGEI